MGLSSKHHGELNKMEVNSSRYNELRQEYSDDKQALQQIDIYDPSTYYHQMFRKYREALQTRDDLIIAECEAWFQENYGEL